MDESSAPFTRLFHAWEPDAWVDAEATRAVGLPASVTPAELKRVCATTKLHALHPQWLRAARNSSFWSKAYLWRRRTHGAAARQHGAEQPVRCEEMLASFRPRMCSLNNIMVYGKHRTLNNATHALVPDQIWNSIPIAERKRGVNLAIKWQNYARRFAADGSNASRLMASLSSRDRTLCQKHRPMGCGGHVVLASNPAGVGYFHTLFDTLNSIAFALDIVRQGAPHVAVLDNLCLKATDGAKYATREKVEERLCSNNSVATPPFVTELFELLGIEKPLLQHYPWLRQKNGVATFADRVTWDCSNAPYRHFWHAKKLQHEMHARLRRPPPQRDAVVVVDRSGRLVAQNRVAVEFTRTVLHQIKIMERVKRTVASMPGNFRAVRFTGAGMRIVDQRSCFIALPQLSARMGPPRPTSSSVNQGRRWWSTCARQRSFARKICATARFI